VNPLLPRPPFKLGVWLVNMPGTVDEELGGRLFEIMIRNMCHAAVIGPSSSVKHSRRNP
jgi:dUTPase